MANRGILNSSFRVGVIPAVWFVLVITSSVIPSPADDYRHDLDYWIAKLQSDNEADHQTALFELKYSASATLPALLAYEHVIRRSNEKNQAAALEIVAQLGPLAQSALPTARQALKSSHRNVRRAAAYCVLRIAGEDDEAFAVMSELLRNGNRDERWEVANNLWVVGITARGCVPALVEATQDSDGEIRRQAAQALGRIGHVPGNVSRGPLKLLLSDESPRVCVDAARALWQLDEPVPSILPTLIELVGSSELKPYRDDEDDRTQLERVAVRHAISMMSEIGPESKAALPVLMKATLSEQLGAKLAAVEALGAIGPEARPALDVLAKALHDSSVESIPFSHTSSSVCDGAAIALQRIGPDSVDVLIDGTRAPEPGIRASAANALGHLAARPEEVVPLLITLLDDGDEAVRAHAAVALGRFGPLAVPAAGKLAARLNDTGEWVSYPGSGIGTLWSVGDHVELALEMISPPPEPIVDGISSELQRSRSVSDSMCRVLRRLGPKARAVVPELASLLDDPESGVRAAAALACIAPDYPGVFDQLRRALVEPESEVFLLAVQAAGDLGQKASGVLPKLTSLLKNWDDPDTSALIAAALLRIDRNQPEAVEALAEGLDVDRYFRQLPGGAEAADVWKSLGPAAAPGIEKLLRGLYYVWPYEPRDYFWTPIREAEQRLRSARLLIHVSAHREEVIAVLIELCGSLSCSHRGEAADQLARIGPQAERAIPALVSLLPDQEEYIIGGDAYGHGGKRFEPGDRAAIALRKIGSPAIPALSVALRDRDPVVRRRAAEALGAMGRPAASTVPELTSLLDDPVRHVRESAARALGKIGATDDSAIGALTRCLVDPHLKVRVAAVEAVGKIGRKTPQLASLLEALLNDSFRDTRNAAKEALDRLAENQDMQKR